MWPPVSPLGHLLLHGGTLGWRPVVLSAGCRAPGLAHRRAQYLFADGTEGRWGHLERPRSGSATISQLLNTEHRHS